MVIVGEKNYKHIDEGPIRSRRTRSPTANAGDNGGSDDEDFGMRVGPEYQASIPDYIPNGKHEGKTEAMLVWAAHPDLEIDKRIDEYASIAKEKHSYNMEQALGMLFWHKHNFDKALADLPNFTPFPDEWTVEDKVLFEQAFGFHGKCFNRIRQMLPDKSVASLVKYYYSWKKTRSRTSLIDRQAHKISSSRDVSDEDGSASSESEDTKDAPKDDTRSSVTRGGLMSPRKIDMHSKTRNKRRAPRGMYLNQESLMSFLSSSSTPQSGQSDVIIKKLETELVELKRQVQNNKQLLSSLKERTVSGIKHLRIPEADKKLNGKWTNDELLLAVQGVRRYGKDYKAIAEVIGNKNESLVRSFFITYRRRYKLDEVLAEYEKEHGPAEQDTARDESPMEEDIVASAGNAATVATSVTTSSSPVQVAPASISGAPSAVSVNAVSSVQA